MLVFITVSAQARPPTEEEDHKGMLRSGGASPRPGCGRTSPRCGWCCAGPGPLGERQITKACCDQGFRAETQHTPNADGPALAPTP